MRLGASLIVALLPVLVSDVASGRSPQEREWTIRRWALDPAEHRVELGVALESTDWRELEQALEALTRIDAVLPDEWLDDCLRALEFDHPSVRATALRALAQTRAAVSISGQQLNSLATDRVPEVRAALARWLGCGGDSLALLEDLVFDADERVRSDARAALFATAESSFDDALRHFLSEGKLDELLEVLGWLRRRIQSGGAAPERTAIPETLSRGRRSLFAALELSRGTGTSQSVENLCAGWFDGELESREVRDFLTETASALEESLAGPLIDLWLAADRNGETEDAKLELLEVAMDALGPNAVMARLSAEQPTKLGMIAALELAGARVKSWDREVALHWLSGGDPELRAACLKALARSATAGDSVSATLLVKVLEHGADDEREFAFEALCDSPEAESMQVDLFRYWIGRDSQQRLQLLRQLPRKVPLTSFRGALLTMGHAGGQARASVLDLLEPFVYDTEIADAVKTWIGEGLEQIAVGDEETKRSAELHTVGALRVLMRISGPKLRGFSWLYAWHCLNATAETSSQVGKVAANWLGKTSGGRAVMTDFFARKALTRTRIEVAIALAPDQNPTAQFLLMFEHSNASWDLASRMLDALGRVSNPVVQAWFVERALDPAATLDVRNSAAEQLAGRVQDSGGLERLVRIARNAPEADTIAIAVRGLAGAGAKAHAPLLQARDELEQAGDSVLGRLTGDSRVLVRLELLIALARSGGLSSDLLSEVLERPMRSADAWLKTRIGGLSLARVEFYWKGELELFGVMSENSAAEAVLEATDDWTRLDGRLLIQLGARAASSQGAASSPTAAIKLLRAGRIALRGEPELDPEADTRARLALLRLAIGASDWDRARHLTEDLALDWREARIPIRVWNTLLGPRDRRTGIDPPARFASLAYQLRARMALERGDLDRARSLGTQAAQRIGFSNAARADQQELESQ